MLLKLPENDRKVMKTDITSRKIRYLVHVTMVENVQSILEKGLVPRDFTSLSISQADPVFYWKRHWECMCSGTSTKNLVAILVDPKVLYEFPCYCFAVGGGLGIHESEFIGKLDAGIKYTSREKFNALFRDVKLPTCYTPNVIERYEKCPAFLPTVATAEILVRDTIPPEMIKRVAFNGCAPLNEYVAEYGKKPIYASVPGVFESNKWQYSTYKEDSDGVIVHTSEDDYYNDDGWDAAFPDFDEYSSLDEYLALHGLD